MQVAWSVAVAAGVAVLMDIWAGFVHRSLWHGPLWGIHRSHHRRRPGRFEANDWLALTHVPPAVLLIALGTSQWGTPLGPLWLGMGTGMTAFGVGYLLAHDGLAHRRLPVGWMGRVPYLDTIAMAHRLHHGGRADGVPYSFFLGPLELRLRGLAVPPRRGAPRGGGR